MELAKFTPTALPLFTGMWATSVQEALGTHVGVDVAVPPVGDVGVAVRVGVLVLGGVVTVAVRVAVIAGVVGVSVGVPQTAGADSNSTALVTVVAVLKPSATSTRPSG